MYQKFQNKFSHIDFSDWLKKKKSNNKSRNNWYEIHFQLEKDDWVKLEKVNPTIALNMLYEKE